ncbi:hypothetical protein G6O69_27760 [Pseudenhygromyxa sp. WMMC2535]|uniref:hypothetical protein n=1 Tax=Pseudenhygromyxa sp. WMMC2535 TaxID=2712867 RepID=UPI001554A6C7|nr:hypothetical protein [Pseudenhygromyxa sp. WMMC2535]NVB41666.1 hypothetical protein [Pseudenhygromyxa sp. WMMC2535]
MSRAHFDRRLPLLSGLLLLACPLPGPGSDGETACGEGEGEGASSAGAGDMGMADSETEDTGMGDTGMGEGEGEGSEPDTPGACLGEVDDPQEDSFVGDGVLDATLLLRTLAAEAPAELELGARIHLQGTAYNCCDDDYSVDESVVVRSYPEERFLLGEVATWRFLPPSSESDFFAAIDSDPETWLRPFELSAHDDMICETITDFGAEAEMTRMRVYVDGGSCETAKIMDENSGSFAERFFVLAGDVHTWSPDGGTVDTVSQARVFISRQSCAPGECPETSVQTSCPADEQWPEDEVSVAFDYDFEPEGDGYDLVCEILDVVEGQGEDEDLTRYELDCGDLCPSASIGEQVVGGSAGARNDMHTTRLVGLPACP